ncbi:Component of oligomeric golgi complex 2 [Trichuris trichiura]|uniref:Conserved oligomeric Golgi complex subunit 2 n=1 Tax=Trichuris trichiura TaxID=36087 RepID=A0A077Z256_TRITR|nr:Component of oligomeric golgi complex 2 [Trichuris trichiura]
MELGFSLERIRDDLRVYLKIIQNSMIEMINQDYAHFVLLSGNIVNLRSPVDKLLHSVENAANEIDQSDTRLKALELTEKLEEQRRLSSCAQRLQSKLITMQLLQRIKSLLKSSNPDSFVLSVLARQILKAKVAVELNDEKSNRDTLNRCLTQIGEYLQAEFGPSFLLSIQNEDHNNVGKLLELFVACGCDDALHAIFIAEFVNPRLNECLSKREAHFKAVLCELIAVHEEYSSLMSKAAKSSGVTFLTDCLLMALVGFTERHLKSSFVPTNPSNFRDTYKAFNNFAAELVRRCGCVEASTSKLLKMTRSKFDVQVYHQLCCLETLSGLEERMKLSMPLEPSTGGAYHYKLHDLLCNTLEKVWSEEQSTDCLFSLPLAWSCLILTFRVLNVYENFVGEYHRNCKSLLDELNFATDKPCKQSVDDIVHFIKDGFQFVDFLSKIYDRLLLLKWSGDFSASRVHEVVKSSLSSIELAISGLVSSLLTDWLSDRLICRWAAVSELPRLFRWTRKENPSTPSSYMMDGCNLLVKIHQLLSDASVPNNLLREMLRRTLDTATSIYANNVSQVLSSVDQVSSSLSKLKRSTKMAAADVLSDDGKIKLQLQLDLFKVKTVLDSLPLPDDCDAYSTLSRLAKEMENMSAESFDEAVAVPIYELRLDEGSQETVDVPVGGPVVLRCVDLSGTPIDNEFLFWLYQGQRLGERNGIMIATDDKKKVSNLKIYQLDESYVGIYECIAKAGPHTLMKAKLRVRAGRESASLFQEDELCPPDMRDFCSNGGTCLMHKPTSTYLCRYVGAC